MAGSVVGEVEQTKQINLSQNQNYVSSRLPDARAAVTYDSLAGFVFYISQILHAKYCIAFFLYEIDRIGKI